MKNIANAIVYAVTYIDCAADEEERRLDQDVGAIESIADMLSRATPGELDALAEAADRALKEELAAPNPRPDFVDSYRSWMENMFSDEEWSGNKRI